MSRRTGPVGVGIIGAGVIAAQHLIHVVQMPDIDVRAIGDLRAEAAAATLRLAPPRPVILDPSSTTTSHPRPFLHDPLVTTRHS
ncbi:MAG: hypothetical protein ACTMII_13055 [Brachybacterium sp.]|uniref:hypothetical protein n=1 Tax=unclassified Brachybacterium TaxID=2623841 RepID=UPI003F8E10D7